MALQRNKPNFFFAFEINDPIVLQNWENVSTILKSRVPTHFHASFSSLVSLHVTLLVGHCPNEQTVSKVKSYLPFILDSFEHQMFQHPIQLTIQGIKCFSPRVVWLDSKKDNHFDRLCFFAAQLRKFIANNIPEMELEPEKPYQPHITIFKSNGLKLHPQIYNDFETHLFGNQEIYHLSFFKIGTSDTNNNYESHAKVSWKHIVSANQEKQ